MKKQSGLSTYHPAVGFLYFTIVLGCSMFCMHPVFLLFSLLGGALYYAQLKGKTALCSMGKRILPLFFMAVIVNPAFQHDGITILCLLPSGNPLTMESLIYGGAAGTMLVAVLLWFACFSEVMTSDKFLYLFGRVIPSLSLVLSMALRMIPLFRAQFDRVREAQAGLGRDTGNGSFRRRFRNTMACFSAVVTWSMENAVDTADSMRSRGYGTVSRRTAYTDYRWESRDKAAGELLLLCGFFFLTNSVAGHLSWRYFPGWRER